MTIKEIRKATGLTQRAFGEKFHIPETNVGHWEQGVSCPTPYVQFMIERILFLEKELDLLNQQLKKKE